MKNGTNNELDHVSRVSKPKSLVEPKKNQLDNTSCQLFQSLRIFVNVELEVFTHISNEHCSSSYRLLK